MVPLVRSGQEVRLVPLSRPVRKGDVVLVRVKGRVYLHLVSAVQGDRIQISNNRGYVNGWASDGYGIAVLRSPRTQPPSPNARTHRRPTTGSRRATAKPDQSDSLQIDETNRTNDS